jgi:hypothetical protein
MFHLNGIALAWMVLAGVAGLGISTLFFGGNPRISGGIAGLVMLIIDAVYRARKPNLKPRERWLSTSSGGFIAIMPSWMMGIALMMMAASQPYWGVVDRF